MKPIPSPHVRTKLVKTNLTINNGRKLAEDTADWMERSKKGFETIYKYVKSLQSKNFKGRVRDRVATFCVDHRITVGSGHDYRFANPLWAGISRYLVLHDPSLDGAPILMHDSDIDCYGLLPISYLPETQERRVR